MIEHYKAVALDPDSCLEQLKKDDAFTELELTNVIEPNELINSVILNKPDLVILDLTRLGNLGKEITANLRKTSTSIPIFLCCTNPNWNEIENDPLVEMVRSPIDLAEVMYRIKKLMHKARLTRYRLPNLVTEQLYSDNGRIDARKVAEMFNLSIPDLAHIIGSGIPALYKTPDAYSIQQQLISFERIACGLLKLTGSVKGLRIWLNAPNRGLDNELPIKYIKDGYVDDIAAIVEDALLGHPS